MSCQPEHYMQIAIELALDNARSQKGGPFAALVVHNTEIIAQATNQVVALHDPTAHAEMMAIRAACRTLNHFQLTDCVLYTTCEPCPMCLGAIYWARLARIFYAATRADAAAADFDDAFIERELTLMPTQRSIPTQQLLRKSALAIFSTWQRNPNKTCY